MGFDSYGAPQFGLKDVKIATWNATDDYATAVDVPSVQLLNTTLRVVSAELEGDDEITASGAKAIGGQVQLRFGSLSMAALEVLLGIASTPSGDDQDDIQVTGGANMPYFGICGKVDAMEGEGDLHVFLPKCKIMSDVQIANAEYGTFMISEVTVSAVADTTYDIMVLVEHAADTAVAIPPANI